MGRKQGLCKNFLWPFPIVTSHKTVVPKYVVPIGLCNCDFHFYFYSILGIKSEQAKKIKFEKGNQGQ